MSNVIAIYGYILFHIAYEMGIQNGQREYTFGLKIMDCWDFTLGNRNEINKSLLLLYSVFDYFSYLDQKIKIV
ncbi:hypothetical protein DHD05_20655 [Arenibacter sp. N53]|nr:hypothetical protein [Arenibacter sp. N53]